LRSINIIILIIMKNKNVYPWIVVALLWVVALLNYMDRQMLSTMQEAMKVDIVELNKAEAFGALMAVFLWIYGFMSPIAGMIADRVNRKWLVVGSLFVWSGVTYLMGYADNFHELYWLRAVMGVSEALYIPSALSLIADWHQGKSRSLAIGVHMTGLYVGQAIGGFGATVAAIFSWHTTFHWFGIVGMIYSVVLIFLLRENPDRMIAEQPSSAAGKEKRPSLFGGLSMLFSTWAFWIILFYFAAPRELKNKYGMFVYKGILSEDYAIAPKSTWADFVFSRNYNLKPLKEVESFIAENEHLPDVPSAAQVAEEGYSQHDMNKVLLQKIEELTLYIIKQQKEIEELKRR